MAQGRTETDSVGKPTTHNNKEIQLFSMEKTKRKFDISNKAESILIYLLIVAFEDDNYL